MKKILIIFLVIFIISMVFKNKESALLIDDGISLRVLANSNSIKDQQLKLKVKEKVQKDIYDLLQDTTDLNEARNLIALNLKGLDQKLGYFLKKENYFDGYTYDFGYYYYPGKKEHGVNYKGGYYESVLVKLGAGVGDNWWCILFPPLCLLEAETTSDVQYQFFVKELFSRFFK